MSILDEGEGKVDPLPGNLRPDKENNVLNQLQDIPASVSLSLL